MSFFRTLDQLSYTKIFSIAIFVAILLAVPVAVFLVQNETRIKSRAAYDKPIVVENQLGESGPIPQEAPKIGRAFPWVGKVGDVIWIQGWNFGNNPQVKELKIGGVTVTDIMIEVWSDNLIQTYIPEGVVQGGTVDVKVGSHPVSRSFPLVIYDQNTKVKLRGSNPVVVNPKEENPWNMPTVLFAEKAQGVTKALIWTGDDEIPTEQHVIDISTNTLGNANIFDTQGLPILSILLVDGKGQIVPYYVDPLEWDF